MLGMAYTVCLLFCDLVTSFRWRHRDFWSGVSRDAMAIPARRSHACWFCLRAEQQQLCQSLYPYDMLYSPCVSRLSWRLSAQRSHNVSMVIRKGKSEREHTLLVTGLIIGRAPKRSYGSFYFIVGFQSYKYIFGCAVSSSWNSRQCCFCLCFFPGLILPPRRVAVAPVITHGAMARNIFGRLLVCLFSLWPVNTYYL